MRIRVGIFYNGDEERESAEEFIKKQMSWAYFGEEPQRVIVSKYGTTWAYENGDVWYSVLCVRAPGRRYNVIYYSSTIEKFYVDCIIRHCAIWPIGIYEEVELLQSQA